MPIATVNEVELYYEERGCGQPLLLVHSTGGYMDMWFPVIDGLASTHRVISYDRRGFAHSSTAPLGRLADHARDAIALLDLLDASPAIVVGWSGGGGIALDIAVSAPERVRGLVLAEPAIHPVTHLTRSMLRMSARSSTQKYLRRDAAEAARTMYRWASRYTTGGNAFDAFPAEWQEQMSAHGAATLREMDQLMRLYPRGKAIRSITCPVTIIEGDLSDASFVKPAAYVKKLLPQARSVRLSGAAHMLHIDQPQQWIDAVATLEAPEPQPTGR